MSFMDSLTKIVGTVTETLDSGKVAAVVEIGQDLIGLVTSAKEVVSTQDQATLDTMLADLEPKVMAHADSTEYTLRGS